MRAIQGLLERRPPGFDRDLKNTGGCAGGFGQGDRAGPEQQEKQR